MDGMEIALLVLLKSNLVLVPTKLQHILMAIEVDMSGCSSGSLLDPSGATVNYLMLLVCRNQVYIYTCICIYICTIYIYTYI